MAAEEKDSLKKILEEIEPLLLSEAQRLIYDAIKERDRIHDIEIREKRYDGPEKHHDGPEKYHHYFYRRSNRLGEQRAIWVLPIHISQASIPVFFDDNARNKVRFEEYLTGFLIAKLTARLAELNIELQGRFAVRLDFIVTPGSGSVEPKKLTIHEAIEEDKTLKEGSLMQKFDDWLLSGQQKAGQPLKSLELKVDSYTDFVGPSVHLAVLAYSLVLCIRPQKMLDLFSGSGAVSMAAIKGRNELGRTLPNFNIAAINLRIAPVRDLLEIHTGIVSFYPQHPPVVL